MRKFWQDVFYWSRSDRRGFFLLLLVVGMVGGLFELFLSEEDRPAPVIDEADRERYEAFVRTLRTDSARRPTGGQALYEPARKVPELFYFDPNTADSTAFFRLGLRAWQVRNIYKYRARGGRYRSSEDFSRLYGLSEETYARLRPFIRIDGKYARRADTLRPDTPRTVWPVRSEKYAQGVRLELNTADTTELQRVPGIGPVLARRIVRYRERLGGYVRPEQLSEVEGVPREVQEWFFVHRPPEARLNLKRLSLDELRRHPYLNFYQSRVIVEHRRKFGSFADVEDLLIYEEFTDSDMVRLRPYVCWE